MRSVSRALLDDAEAYRTDAVAAGLAPAAAALAVNNGNTLLNQAIGGEAVTRALAGDNRPGLARHSVTIELLQPTGSRTYATFRLGDADVVAELQAHDVTQIHQQVELALDMNRAILIDPGTEKVI